MKITKKQLFVAALIAVTVIGGQVQANFLARLNTLARQSAQRFTARWQQRFGLPARSLGEPKFLLTPLGKPKTALTVVTTPAQTTGTSGRADGNKRVTRPYMFKDFDSLRLRGADAHIATGGTDSYMVELEGREQDLDAMRVAQNGAQLTVEPAASSWTMQHGDGSTVATVGGGSSVVISGNGGKATVSSSVSSCSTGNSSVVYSSSTLSVSSDGSTSFISSTGPNSFNTTLQKVMARILMPKLAYLKASNASNVVVAGSPIASEKFRVNASLASHIDVRNSLSAGVVEADATNSSSVTLRGTCAHLKASAQMSGAINAQELIAQKAIVDASQSGKVNVHATEELHAESSLSGRINYYGDPKRIREKAELSGTVQRKI